MQKNRLTDAENKLVFPEVGGRKRQIRGMGLVMQTTTHKIDKQQKIYSTRNYLSCFPGSSMVKNLRAKQDFDPWIGKILLNIPFC